MRPWFHALPLAAALFLLCQSASAIGLQWVSVGNAGNACDVQGPDCFGAVAYDYEIGKFEVSNAEYAAFLNAVAAIPTNALYNASMGSGLGGITRSGSPGSYTYDTIAGREDMPVNFVSFYDAIRFANWLHNGQPTGAQDGTTTEDGAYTITAQGVTNNTIVRNGGAGVALASEDEWYKAAYYDASGMDYFDYPAGTDSTIVCAAPSATSNTANCQSVVGDVTQAGDFTGSPSPYGTFDQGGNVWEWSEAIIDTTDRGLRGGSYNVSASLIAASAWNSNLPTMEFDSVGFRVARLPEPTTGMLYSAALLGLLVLRRHTTSV